MVAVFCFVFVFCFAFVLFVLSGFCHNIMLSYSSTGRIANEECAGCSGYDC